MSDGDSYVSISVLEVGDWEGDAFVSLLPLQCGLEKLNSPSMSSDVSFSEKPCLMLLYEAVCSSPAALSPSTLNNCLLLLTFSPQH